MKGKAKGTIVIKFPDGFVADIKQVILDSRDAGISVAEASERIKKMFQVAATEIPRPITKTPYIEARRHPDNPSVLIITRESTDEGGDERGE